MPTLTPAPAAERPARRRRRSYPAGRAIAVVLLALFFAALLDADSLVASVSSEPFGTSRSVELALVRPFRTVSDALGLNLPHRWLADIGGTNQHSPGVSTAPPTTLGAIASSPDLIPRGLPEVRTRPLTSIARPPPTAPPPTAPPPPRTPTVGTPLKIWLAGDSLMGALADAFMSHVTGDPAVRASEDVQIGTGLARPDVYDWPGAIAKEVQTARPDVVVVTFGANDDQDMASATGYLVRNTPAWQAEYARRVALVMSEVAGSGRLLVWIQVPPVARPQLQQTDQIIDGILRRQAAIHPGVVVVNPGPVLAPNGTFTEYLPGSAGQPVQVRDTDGVHVTPAGAGRVLPLLLAAIRPHWTIP